ncbi:hypothetical protein [Bacillus sp. AK031]
MLERGIQNSANHPSFSRQSFSALSEGQLIFAKVNKLLPDSMAEINYQGQKAIVKLEVPLKPGSAYFFQTDLAEEGFLKLKLASPQAVDSKPAIAGQAESLISDLKLPKNGMVRELVTVMAKHSIPFTKDELSRMVNLLSQTDDTQAGMETMLKLKGAGLPVSKDLYLSFLHGRSMEPLSLLMDNLEGLLKKNVMRSQYAENVLSALAGVKDTEVSTLFQKTAIKASEILMNPSNSDSQRLPALNLLQTLGAVPVESSLEAVKLFAGREGSAIQRMAEYVNSMGTDQTKDTLIALQEQLSRSKPLEGRGQSLLTEVQAVLRRANEGNASFQELQKQSLALISQGGELFSRKEPGLQLKESERFNLMLGIHSAKERLILSDFSQTLQFLQKPDNPKPAELKLLQNLLFNETEEKTSSIQKESLPGLIKELLSKLGVDYEAKLAADGERVRQNSESLKPALIALLKELPQGGIREAAEKVLYKLNGHAALSGESGPLQHIIYQFPLSWLNQKTDITMQWTGRKTGRDSIDSGFCRVLFYLDLENLREVVVDMAVQNRVIALNIYNDTPQLKEISAPFYPVIKKGLEKLDYKVSSINFKEPGHAAPLKKVYKEMAEDMSYSGVDLRI